MSTLALTLAPARSRTTARLAFQVACAVVGSFLVAGLAQISIHLGFTPVPITGQTLGVLLIGAAYGPALGSGHAGPVPGVGRGGAARAGAGRRCARDGAARARLLVRHRRLPAGASCWPRASWDGCPDTVGTVRCAPRSAPCSWARSCCTPWACRGCHHFLGGTWQDTLSLGLYPFVIGDTLKLLAAAGLLPVAWKVLNRLHPDKADTKEA